MTACASPSRPTRPIGYASPIDASAYGEHRITAPPTRPRPARQFSGRITRDGSSGYPAEPGRYHLYLGWFCPWSHRATIQRALNGLAEIVSVSYVDGLRDGRGWAFRQSTGPDSVNGFTLLREAYEASEPGYDGNVSIPVLWDRDTSQIVSNNADTIDLDLATAFGSKPGVDTYPTALRAQIDDLSRHINTLQRAIPRAVYHETAKSEVRAAWRDLDNRLAHQRYLFGNSITVTDVRLWVILARYDAGANANGAVGPELATFSHLWAYARDLYSQPAFRDTTDFAAFKAQLSPLPDWTEPARRADLSLHPATASILLGARSLAEVSA